MSTNTLPTFLARLARRPLPIFLGVAVGFLSCCMAGRVAARQQPMKNFVRFHQGISPEAHYYPTYSQTLNLAREHAKPGKTLVIITGDSVLHGVGQRPTHVWTAHLQKVLGDDYAVLNLALRAGVPQEYGLPVAEQLHAEGVPVIVVCRGNLFDWDGYLNRYFFWDAWGKGYVQPDSRRDKWLDEFTTKYAKDAKSLELKHRGRVDGAAYASDLWTYVAYKHRATVWSPVKYPNFWRPHREATDPDPGALVEYEPRFNPAPDSPELKLMRQFTNQFYSDALVSGKQDQALGGMFKSFIPDSLQDRVLYVFRLENSFYRSLLTPEEQMKYVTVNRCLRDATRRVGLQAELIGADYAPRDYVDLTHLSESGGNKLAEELAPTIRAMNERLRQTNTTDARAKP
jgi:hypothetical protein